MFDKKMTGTNTSIDKVSYESALMTINHALDNHFDMACELVHQAKKDTMHAEIVKQE